MPSPAPLRIDVHAPILLRYGSIDVSLEPLSPAGQPVDWDAFVQRWSAAHPGDDAIPSRNLDDDPVLHLPELLRRLRAETFEPRELTPWLQAATGGLVKSFDGHSEDAAEQAEGRLRWTNHLMAQEATIALLLEHGARPDPYVVSQVVMNGNPRLLQRVLDAGGAGLDWSSQGMATTYDLVRRYVMTVPKHARSAAAKLGYSVSPLIATTYHTDQSGSVTMARMMLGVGTPVDLVDPANGNSALHWAVCHGGDAVVDLLLTLGANPHQRNQDGHTPLHLAAHDNRTLAIDLLRAYGARLDDEAPALPDPHRIQTVPFASSGRAPVLGHAAPEDLPWSAPEPSQAQQDGDDAPRLPGPFRDTPIVQAAYQGSTHALNHLLDLGVDPLPRQNPSDPASPVDDRVLRLLRYAHGNAIETSNAWRASAIEATLQRVEGCLLRLEIEGVTGDQPVVTRMGRRL